MQSCDCQYFGSAFFDGIQGHKPLAVVWGAPQGMEGQTRPWLSAFWHYVESVISEGVLVLSRQLGYG